MLAIFGLSHGGFCLDELIKSQHGYSQIAELNGGGVVSKFLEPAETGDVSDDIEASSPGS